MRIDPATLSVITVFVTTLLGLLLLFAWWQNRAVRALAFAGASYLAGAVALVLFVGRGQISHLLSILGANALLFLALGLFWAGIRAFEGRRAHPIVVSAGAVAWVAACGLPAFYKSVDARIVLASLAGSAYYLAAAFELWRGRGERLLSRGPLLVLLVLHALVVLGRYPLIWWHGGADERTLMALPWFAFHAFEGILFLIVAAFLLIAMAKERSELEHRTAASLDPLTGVPNRRGFLERVRPALDGDRRAGRPAALLLLDLDHFKRINDAFGHAAGDEALRIFARTALSALPADAVFGRLGGEEFACLLPGSPEKAWRVAERVRESFARVRHGGGKGGFHATVSIGIATTADAGHVVEALLAAADVTLYRAKGAGRDRVEAHGAEPVLRAA